MVVIDQKKVLSTHFCQRAKLDPLGQSIMLVENAGLLLSAAVPILLIPYLLGAVIPALRLRWYTSGFPVINKLKGEWSDKPAVKRIARDMKAWIQKGYGKVGNAASLSHELKQDQSLIESIV